MNGLSELLYADDLLLICDPIGGLIDKSLKWQVAFESTGLGRPSKNLGDNQC